MSNLYFGPLHPSNSTEAVRCIHFYSCIAVFSGDSKLSKEFARFIIDDKVRFLFKKIDAHSYRIQISPVLVRTYQDSNT